MNVKYKSICFLCFAIVNVLRFPIYDFNSNHLLGANAAAIGNCAVTQSDVWSVYHNQAGLADIKKIAVGLGYESRFLLPEMGLKGGVIVIPLQNSTFGISISSFGYAQYNENKYGLAFARHLGKVFSVGIQLDYLNTAITENYGTKGVLVAEAGIQAQITKELLLGMHIFNPNNSKIANYNDERIPSIMRFGLKYQFSDKVFVCSEVEKDIDFNPIVKAGVEYRFIDVLYLRTGISTAPFLSSFGIGVHLNKFMLDLASSYHTLLGYSPQMSLKYSFE